MYFNGKHCWMLHLSSFTFDYVFWCLSMCHYQSGSLVLEWYNFIFISKNSWHFHWIIMTIPIFFFQLLHLCRNSLKLLYSWLYTYETHNIESIRHHKRFHCVCQQILHIYALICVYFHCTIHVFVKNYSHLTFMFHSA